MSLNLVIQQVQNLWRDRTGKWLDKDTIIGDLQLRNMELESRLQALGLEYDTDVIIVTPVAANTTDLGTYQGAGNVLDPLMSPISIRWRHVGENDEQWRVVDHVDRVLETNEAPSGQPVASQTDGVSSWEWRKGKIFISPSSSIVELEVRGNFLPSVLQADSDDYIKGMTYVLACWTAELIGMIRGSGSSKLALYFKQLGDKGLDDVEDILVQQDQLVNRRFAGRRSHQQNPLWKPPMG